MMLGAREQEDRPCFNRVYRAISGPKILQEGCL